MELGGLTLSGRPRSLDRLQCSLALAEFALQGLGSMPSIAGLSARAELSQIGPSAKLAKLALRLLCLLHLRLSPELGSTELHLDDVGGGLQGLAPGSDLRALLLQIAGIRVAVQQRGIHNSKTPLGLRKAPPQRVALRVELRPSLMASGLHQRPVQCHLSRRSPLLSSVASELCGPELHREAIPLALQSRRRSPQKVLGVLCRLPGQRA
mmetsp:Transcript_3541/g.8309  ORF Transcript_3541/g.8309 Transcript_3541/m.8309 type:complete len:209 (-) Transcript_3541:558-1184(-)